MSSKYFALIAAAFIAGGAFILSLQHISVSTGAPSNFEKIKTTLAAIPTPEHWIGQRVPVRSSGDPSGDYAVTFTNYPSSDESHRKEYAGIVVTGRSLLGQSLESWIVPNVYPKDAGALLSSATTTWAVVHGRLILSGIAKSIDGIDIPYHYVFDDGAVYEFSLFPSIDNQNPGNSLSNIKLLDSMVKQFADSLPAINTTK